MWSWKRWSFLMVKISLFYKCGAKVSKKGLYFVFCNIEVIKEGLFKQFIACNYCMQSSALFKDIFKFCIFLPKFSSILPFFNILLPFFWKMATMPLLSRIGPVKGAKVVQCKISNLGKWSSDWTKNNFSPHL